MGSDRGIEGGATRLAATRVLLVSILVSESEYEQQSVRRRWRGYHYICGRWREAQALRSSAMLRRLSTSMALETNTHNYNEDIRSTTDIRIVWMGHFALIQEVWLHNITVVQRGCRGWAVSRRQARASAGLCAFFREQSPATRKTVPDSSPTLQPHHFDSLLPYTQSINCKYGLHRSRF
jgi:hypothetical protein